MTSLLVCWLLAVVAIGWVHHRSVREAKREEEQVQELEAAMVARLRSDLQRYEVSGVALVPAVETVYERPIGEAESDAMQARMALGLMAPVMARAMRRAAPMRAEA